MPTVASAVQIAAPREAVWNLYFDADGWTQWVDQFSAVVSSMGYPEAGGELVWRSGPAGRGEVRERVVEHQPQRRHAIEFEDPSAGGRLSTSFEDAAGGTTVSLELHYELQAAGLFARISDALFVRSQMRASLSRSLGSLRLEAEAR